MKYQQPFGVSDPDAQYVNGWVPDGIDGSIPPALAFEQPMRELVSMITLGGFTPSNGDLDQVPKGIRSGLYNYLVDTGPTNAMVVTPALPLDAYTEGLPLRVKVGHANTAPVTLNVSNLGPVLVVKANGSTLSSGDLVGGQILDVIYDGVNFQITNFMGLTAGTTTNNFLALALPYVVDSSTTSNYLIGIYTPVIPTPLVEGLFISIKLANPINGPTTIKVNANAPAPITHGDGTPLGPGQAATGQVLLLIYDGVKFQLSGGGYAPTNVVKDALFPHAIYAQASPITAAPNVLTPLGPFAAGVGDPVITGALNLSNCLFTCPVGQGGFWMFTTYFYQNDPDHIDASPDYLTASIRLFTGTLASGTMIASAHATPSNEDHETEAGLCAFANLADGQTVQVGYVCDIPGRTIRKFGFTAIRFGRSI